jgi:cytochrome b6-f complex iron-sulfur subunit
MNRTTGTACDGESAACDGDIAGDTLAGQPLGGIARRTFIVQSALLAAAAALAACSGAGGATAPSLTSSGTPNTIDVASYPTLAAVGGIAMVSVGGAQLAIVRTGTSSFVALSRVCPHQGGTVQQSGSGFQCPVHGARFSQTGQWVGGQQTGNLHAYTTSYDATTSTLTIS